MLPRITDVRHLADHRLALRFSDGASGEIDLRDQIVGRGGVLRRLEDVEEFSRVRVDRDAGTITWDCGIDLCPDVLYAAMTGKPLPIDQRATG